MNELSLTFGKKFEADRRYRVLVALQRSDRPKYWTFHCPHCQRPLGEMVNAEMAMMTDVINMNDVHTIAWGMRCSTGTCRYWYYFLLHD